MSTYSELNWLQSQTMVNRINCNTQINHKLLSYIIGLSDWHDKNVKYRLLIYEFFAESITTEWYKPKRKNAIYLKTVIIKNEYIIGSI